VGMSMPVVVAVAMVVPRIMVVPVVVMMIRHRRLSYAYGPDCTWLSMIAHPCGASFA
jgi:hypothetical protein